MSQAAHYLRFVYTILAIGFVASCAPQSKTQVAVPPSEITYDEQAATPTVIFPKAADAPKYQPLPKKIINTSSSKAPVEIILGAAEIRNPKVSYRSVEGKMQIAGSVVITNDLHEKLTEKFFALEGAHSKKDSIFVLREGTSGPEDTPSVSAQANCISTASQNSVDCNHVLIDVYIFYKNKYYTEQIELNRKNTEVVEVPPAVVTAPQIPAETSLPQQPVQNENDDHTQTQQTEEADESISGRYQGGAETVDLAQLFPQEELMRKEKEERVNEPATPAAPATPIVPTAPPAAVKSKDETKATPPALKEKILSPDLKQTPNGEVRPFNQALGFPDEGSLRNATSLLTRQQALSKKAFFEIVAPNRNKHFATYDMAELITRTAEQLNKQFSKMLYVANLSAQNGGELTAIINGKLTKHGSHQNGLDADLAYPTDLAHLKFPLVVRMKPREYFPKNYSVEKTYALIKFLFNQKDIPVDRFFMDQKVKDDLCTFAIAKNDFENENKAQSISLFESIQHVAGHGDHFHVRIKCSKSDPACRGRIYKKMPSCKI